MNKKQITQTADNFEALFESIMQMYYTYIEALEKIIPAIPDSEVEVLLDLNNHLQEVQEAMEHDISIFEAAIQTDLEDISQIKDQLQVDSIRQKLKQT